MKKVLSVALIICVLIPMLAACGSEKMADYVKLQNDEFASTINSAEVNGSCKASGSTLIFSYKMSMIADKETAELILDSTDEANAKLLSQAKSADIGCKAVIVEYLDASGNVLASKEYK
ncbi:MAG: DUF4854 domain-containing protein [Oscillospiraceae bacterium]|nr:DUF4854 domain-containing protein [Oscillospiraceae bacterium]